MDRNTRIIAALTSLLAVALGAAALAYLLGDKQNRELTDVRLDPLGITEYPVGEDPSLAASDRRVVFFGDSRAQFWPRPAELPGGYQVVNRGIGRQTSPQALERFDRHVAQLHPALVVIEVGVNDLTKIAVFPGRRDAIVAACKRNIDEIVARSRRAGARVVLATVFPIGKMPFYRRLFWSRAIDGAIAEVNEHLKALAGADVALLDAGPLLVDASGVVRPELSDDHLHLNGAGYAALDRGLVPLIEKLLP